MIGASIKPTPRPINIAAPNTISEELANASINHDKMCGILNNIIARFLPIGSDNHPERALPSG